MPTYDDLIDRTGSEALMPEDAAREIIQSAVEQSVVLSRFRRVQMSRAQKRLPVLSAFPAAYFVDGDTGLKQTTKQQWANKFLNAEEIAVIVPIPEAVLEDSDYPVWEEVQPRAAESVGLLIDESVFFGTPNGSAAAYPSSWPTAIHPDAVAKGNAYTIGTSSAAEGGVAEDINQTMGLVEGDGFAVMGFYGPRSFRSVLRGARATDGQRLLDVGANGDAVHGLPVNYALPGLFPQGGGAPRLFAGDWSQFIVGVRRDISIKLLTESVISDDDGKVILNLAQQDSVALRLTIRIAWQVANPLTRDNPNDATRYPVAVLRNEPGSPAS